MWRTCRVLANRRRLEVLGELFKRPGQRVGEVSTSLKIPIAVASKSLRELSARGLLAARRHSSEVRYFTEADPLVSGAAEVLVELQKVFKNRQNPSDFVFHRSTAFTHPRRIAIIAAIASGCRWPGELRMRTGISRPAVMRHLSKLTARGFVFHDRTGYSLPQPDSSFDSLLLRLAKRT
ncbi:MAG: hypothetical protein C0404_10790 [Verrucomicrobia bacterium]|nr:hypothetical protein [Verrucomicrobiota bacterium]